MKEVTITSKLQLIVESEFDKQKLIETMKAYTAACNEVSDYVFSTKTMSRKSVHNANYELIRLKFLLKSQMAESVMRTVLSKYRAIKSNKHAFTKPKFNKLQYELVWNKDYSLNFEKKIFSVNTLYGRIKLPFFDTMDNLYSGRIGGAKLCYRHGKFYLHVSVTRLVPDVLPEDIVNVNGIDRGVRFPATSYNSSGRTTFYSGKELMKKRAHFKAIRSELQRIGTPSSRRRLKAIGNRETRYMNDVNHCIAKALVNNNPEYTLHVLEDLTGVRKATEKVRVRDRYVMVSWPYYDLEKKLTYKAELHNQTILKVNPAYTSQTCPVCGCVRKDNRDKKKHIFKCKDCSYQSNDDRIGAMNLYLKGTAYLLKAATTA